MRNKDIAGYISLFTGVYLFFGLGYFTEGLFMQGMALGFFGTSCYEQIKQKLRQKKLKEKHERRKLTVKVVNSPNLTDKEKIELLGLNTSAELTRLKSFYKENRLS